MTFKVTIKVNSRPFLEENFESLFKTYFGPLANYVNKHIGDWEGSREIVQGCFLKIWENRERIEISTSVQSYLYSAVRNRMIDHIRTNGKSTSLTEEIEIEEEKNEEDPLRNYLIRQEILKALDKMKPKMKQIFTLSKLEGLTYGEIASYLNISKRAVEDNVAKALILLKDELKNNEIIFS